MRVLVLATVFSVACGGSSLSSNGGSSGGSGGRSGGGPGGSGNGAGTAGKAGGGGSGGETECGPTMTFRMLGGQSAGTYCVGKPGSCGGGGFVTVHDSDGNVMPLGADCSVARCDRCESMGCPAICGVSTPLPEAGVEMSWAGTQWVGGACGDNIACQRPVCAPAGDYVARFCAYALAADGGAGGAGGDGSIDYEHCEAQASHEPTCVEVPFTFPSSEVVIGVIEAP